ncbi:MAG: TonB-dependent receptor, partial [Flavobacteriaceae bacterium]
MSIQNIKYCFFSLITGLSVLINPLFAQEEFALTLTINDSEDQVPLEGVTVLIEPCGCGGITNVSGIFNKRLVAGTYTLTIDYLGYGQQILTIDLNKSQSLAVGMRVVEEQLSEVVLLAEQQNKNIESPQMGVLELNVRDLIKVPAAMGEFDILKSITLMAGVNSSGDISNGVSIRGGSLDQNLLLYDGAPVFNPTHLFGLFSVFTPDVISGVDIYRANIPAKYGGRIASVVEVKVKNPYTDRFKLEGGLGLISNRLSITTPLISNKLMITAGVRTGFSDLLFPLLIPRLKNTRANFLDSTVKLLYLLNPNNQFSYTYFLSDDFYQLDLISSIENIVSSSNQYDFSTRNHTLKWLHTFKNETNLTTRFIQSTYTPKNLFPELESDNSIVYKSQIQYSNLQSEFTNYKNENWSFYGGLDLKRYLLAPGSLDPGNGNSINPVILNQEEGFEASMYSSLEWNPTAALSLSAGLRLTQFLLLGPFEEAQYTPDGAYESSIYFDPNEKVISYFNPEPRLGLNYKLTENTAVKASYARIFQYIQNIYNTNTPLPTSRWKISDRYIKPQENSTYGFGVYQNLLEG